ncbi:MAG: HPr family phosphocarrier protein [Pyrinomonadaceae bacterium]
MQRDEVEIINNLGLHARAAAQLVKLANQFDAEITLTKLDDGVTANVRSILNVLLLAASRGTKLLLQTNGKDERRAHEAILTLIAERFGEEE